jgi:hypothetical protein
LLEKAGRTAMTWRSGFCKGASAGWLPGIAQRAGKRLEIVSWTTPGRFATMFNSRERRSRSLFRERRRAQARRRLTVEVLEERFLLSNVYQVQLSTDKGTGVAMNSLS